MSKPEALPKKDQASSPSSKQEPALPPPPHYDSSAPQPGYSGGYSQGPPPQQYPQQAQQPIYVQKPQNNNKKLDSCYACLNCTFALVNLALCAEFLTLLIVYNKVGQAQDDFSIPYTPHKVCPSTNSFSVMSKQDYYPPPPPQYNSHAQQPGYGGYSQGPPPQQYSQQTQQPVYVQQPGGGGARGGFSPGTNCWGWVCGALQLATCAEMLALLIQ